MISFRAVVLKHQIRPDKTVRIKIQVTVDKERKFIDSGLTATTADITKERIKRKNGDIVEVLKIKNHVFIDATNEIIKEYRDKCNKFSKEVSSMGAGELVEFLTKKEEVIDFIAFAKKHVANLLQSGHKGVAKNRQTAINALIRFYGEGKVLPAEQITHNFLNRFEGFICNNPVIEGKGMGRALSLYMAQIRAIHNKLKEEYNDEDVGIIRVPNSPFKKYRVKKEPKPQKRAIDANLIRKIREMDYREITNSSGSNRFNLAKDVFILSFCLVGMNSIDLYNCTDYRNGVISYERRKTRNRRDDRALIKVKVQPEIEPLLKKYRDPDMKRVFNFYHNYVDEGTFNKAINKGLKEIDPELTFYSARHSWATIAINRVKIDKYTVHTALNHVDEHTKITDVYIEKDFGLIDAANRKVLNYVFKKKEAKVIQLAERKAAGS